MTLDTFRLLAPRVQVTFALMQGTYLAHRWEEEGRLRLYYLPDGVRGFFIEIGYDAHDGRGSYAASLVRCHWKLMPIGCDFRKDNFVP